MAVEWDIEGWNPDESLPRVGSRQAGFRLPNPLFERLRLMGDLVYEATAMNTDDGEIVAALILARDLDGLAIATDIRNMAEARIRDAVPPWPGESRVRFRLKSSHNRGKRGVEELEVARQVLVGRSSVQRA